MPPGTALPSPSPKQPSVWKWPGILFLLFHLGIVLEEMLRSRNEWWNGFSIGIFWSLFTGVLWLAIVLPWGWIVRGIYRWRNWRRFQRFWVILPALYFCGGLAWLIAQSPPTAAGVFLLHMKSRLPENVMNLKWKAGGGCGDQFTGRFSFITTADETSRLIRELHVFAAEKEKIWTRQDSSGKWGPDFPDGEKVTIFSNMEEWPQILLYAGEDRRRVFIRYMK